LSFTEAGQSAVAVDEATGNLFASDGPEFGGNGIVILGAEGSPPVGVKAPYVVPGTNVNYFEGNGSAFLAFDNSPTSAAKGTLYAYDGGSEAIRKYALNVGAEEYEETGSLPTPGCGFSAGGGIDAQGNVYFSCHAQRKVVVFSPTGAQIAEYDFSGTVVSEAGQIAIDSAGDLFIQTSQRALYKVPADALGALEPSRITLVAGGVSGVSGVTYDPGGNEVIATEQAQAEEFDATSLAKVGAFGAATLVPEANAQQVAVNVHAHRVYVVLRGIRAIAAFGPDVLIPSVRTFNASNVRGTRAVLNGAVNLEGTVLTECKFEIGATESYGGTVPCAQAVPPDSEAHAVSAEAAGLVPGHTTYHYRLVAANSNGSAASADRTFTTAELAVSEPASSVSYSSATLNGVAWPEGAQLSECRFEWGLTTQAGFEHSDLDCVPSAALIDPDFAAHPVTAALQGLKANTPYKFRLMTNGPAGASTGVTRVFTTLGGPEISEVRARGASSGSVVLEAKINPSGFPTSYRFEWGTGVGYGSLVPAEFEPTIGAGPDPSRVAVNLSGLAPATRYHYRVMARNSAAGATATVSADREFETLDTCGLPDRRCLEMVSPPGLRVVALPQEQVAGLELSSQAADEPGRMAFETEFGFQGTEVGGESLYVANRDSSGWQARQYTPPMTGAASGGNQRSQVLGLSPNLDCGVLSSSLPLTPDPPARLVERSGGANLYRRGPGGGYTLITNIAPDPLPNFTEPTQIYRLIGMSPDCMNVVFETKLHYPGVSGAGEGWRIYEWDGGILRGVGLVPDGSGTQVAVEASAGGPGTDIFANAFNAVSRDGSRVFFTATSRTGLDQGNQAVFGRIGGSESLDVSQSSLAADAGADFQGATPDGSRVYFTANAGLTPKSNTSGRDLYECRIVPDPGSGAPKCELMDISVGATGEPAEVGARTTAGLQVGALVGVSDDGSHVYFIARGQLVPGHGKTAAENVAAGMMSLYLAEPETESLKYVGAIGDAGDEVAAVTTGEMFHYTSRVSGNGRYLLFESLAEPGAGGSRMAYLFDADASIGSEAVTCISCRQDGSKGIGAAIEPNQAAPVLVEQKKNTTYLAQALVMRQGRPIVFFRSRDALAPGAIEGEWTLYEWAHDQVFRIASDLERGRPGSIADGTLGFIGASSDGADLYFVGGTALTWEDPDGRKAIWDARVSGGFGQPAPAVNCDPNAEGSCQGPPSSIPGSPSVGTAGVVGGGNLVAPSSKPKKKRKGHRHHRKKNRHARSGDSTGSKHGKMTNGRGREAH
jgi:hypothetical protein